MLLYARPAVEAICLGRHGHGRIMPQEQVNQLLVEKAKQGQAVVRLKCGDPAVFGRLAEELEALAAENINYEIVPGITAAHAAPSLAGVTVTHRDSTSSVALVTGREQQETECSKLDYEALARFPGTLVFYMGVTTAPVWSAALIEAGRSGDTPAVLVHRCGWTDQQVVSCTLGTVADEIERRKMRPPVVVMIGDACREEALFQWYRQRPLAGQTVLVTRPLHQASELCQRLVQQGAGCMVQPVIAIEPPSNWALVDDAIDRLSTYDWVVFSSANGVRSMLDRIWQQHGDLRQLGGVRLAVIGPRTAQELTRYFLKPDVAPSIYRAEELAAALAPVAADRRFLLCRASRGRDTLATELAAAGGLVDQVVVYESIDVTDPSSDVIQALDSGQIDWITVTSSAIAHSLVNMFADRLRHCRLVSISPLTSATLTELGYPPATEARDYTTDGVIEAIIGAVRDNRA